MFGTMLEPQNLCVLLHYVCHRPEPAVHVQQLLCCFQHNQKEFKGAEIKGFWIKNHLQEGNEAFPLPQLFTYLSGIVFFASVLPSFDASARF